LQNISFEKNIFLQEKFIPQPATLQAKGWGAECATTAEVHMRTQRKFSHRNRLLRRAVGSKQPGPRSSSNKAEGAQKSILEQEPGSLNDAKQVLRLAEQEGRLARQEREFAEYCLEEVRKETMWLAEHLRPSVKYL
jgi:hypothetical protein